MPPTVSPDIRGFMSTFFAVVAFLIHMKYIYSTGGISLLDKIFAFHRVQMRSHVSFCVLTRYLCVMAHSLSLRAAEEASAPSLTV